MQVELRYCNYCECEHPVTPEFWTFKPNGKVSACKKKVREYSKKHWYANHEYSIERKRRYREENRQILRDKNKEYCRTHTEQRALAAEKYYEANRELLKQKTREKKREQYKNDISLRDRHYVTSGLRNYLFGNKKHLSHYIGMTSSELQEYLEHTYEVRYKEEFPGNEYVHIDHIIPLASFHSREGMLIGSHYTNLQFLKPKDNRKKSNKKVDII